MAREHVREKPDAQRDQPHELAEDLERHDQAEQELRRLGDPALEVANRPVPADALEMREDEREQRERERHRERRRRGVDPPRRHPVPLLPGERQRDEAEQVHDPDEEHDRGDVREPAADRLRRQALLRDLGLRDLVDGLADRLAPVGKEREPAAHREEPERDREDGSDQQVDDGLRDREVERAEVDRDPLVLLELGGRVELAPGERGRRRSERERRHDEQVPQPHRGPVLCCAAPK